MFPLQVVLHHGFIGANMVEEVDLGAVQGGQNQFAGPLNLLEASDFRKRQLDDGRVDLKRRVGDRLKFVQGGFDRLRQ